MAHHHQIGVSEAARLLETQPPPAGYSKLNFEAQAWVTLKPQLSYVSYDIMVSVMSLQGLGSVACPPYIL